MSILLKRIEAGFWKKSVPINYDKITEKDLDKLNEGKRIIIEDIEGKKYLLKMSWECEEI